MTTRLESSVDATSADEPAIRATGIRKSFGTTKAVDGVDLTVTTGSIAALLGKNGAGKTTLIDIILGLQRPTEGTARLFGMAPRDAIRRSLVGVVHQTGALLTDYTVRQVLTVFAATHTRTVPLAEVLAETHLTGLAGRRVGKLSGGEQQRVRLALALLPDPELLILDEPTAGMDATARRDFWALMRAQAERGRTIIFATHYLAEAEEFAQRTIIMKAGRLVADAPTEVLRRAGALRTLRILIPSVHREEARARLAALATPGSVPAIRVEAVPSQEGLDEFSVQSEDTDEAARQLLAVDGAHGLEIVASSLEDTFAQLTA
ncbi:MAG: ABC transporter ATP-binding protein [Propionibacteriaceae bacterium]|nr:ABC transporter ATP-binding protein [Propionibacteriaceae bacterium]